MEPEVVRARDGFQKLKKPLEEAYIKHKAHTCHQLTLLTQDIRDKRKSEIYLYPNFNPEGLNRIFFLFLKIRKFQDFEGHNGFC